jgi:hypothetical protein
MDRQKVNRDVERIVNRHRSPDDAGYISSADVAYLQRDLIALVDQAVEAALADKD